MLKHEDLEYRNMPQSMVGINVSSSKTGERIEGYAAVFDSLSVDMGGWYEVIRKGTFAKSLKTNAVKAYLNHNDCLLLGSTTTGSLQLREDNKGLRFSLTLPRTSYAKDMVQLLRANEITGCSFGFRNVTGTDVYRQENGQNIRELNEVFLYEISPVTGFPAYPGTSLKIRYWDKKRQEMENKIASAEKYLAADKVIDIEDKLREFERFIAS